ncbi:MAG: hypothetical protein ACLFU7_01315 [Armatimonadota bacterium]
MRLHRTVVITLLTGLLGLLAAANAAWALETEKLKFVANLSEDRIGDDSEYDLAAALDAVWATDNPDSRWEITLNSDYDRSLTEAEDYDRLKTWFRYLLKERPQNKWNPLIAVSTDGDHGLDQVQTLVALGWRRHFDGGYVELTGGGSKDVRTSEDWKADVGALVQIEKDFGRFTWTVNPEVNYGVLGEVRVRDNRTLYSFRSGLAYEITDGVGITYKLQLDNTQQDDRRHQMLGFSYSYAN